MSILPITFGSVVDVLALALALFFLLRGMLRGASGEISRIIGFFGGSCVGYMLYQPVRQILLASPGQASSVVVALTALALVVVIGFVTGLLLRYACIRLLQIVILEPADAILGVVAGAVYATVILGIVFALGMLIPHPPLQQVFTEQSVVGRFVCPRLRLYMGLT